MVVDTVEDGKKTDECLSGLDVSDSASPDWTVAMFELVSMCGVEDTVSGDTPIELVAVEESAGSKSVDSEVRSVAELLEKVGALHKVAGPLVEDADQDFDLGKAFLILLSAGLVPILTSAWRTLCSEPPEVRFSGGGLDLKKSHFGSQMLRISVQVD